MRGRNLKGLFRNEDKDKQSPISNQDQYDDDKLDPEQPCINEDYLPRQVIDETISLLMSKHIRLVAFDFDLTIYQEHTGGGVPYDSNLNDLVTKISPLFIQLVPELQAAGLRIAIVTFSDDGDTRSYGGYALISTLLQVCFKKKIIWNPIIIVACNPEFHSFMTQSSPSFLSEDDDLRMDSMSMTFHDVDEDTFDNEDLILPRCRDAECICTQALEPCHISQAEGKDWHIHQVLLEHYKRTGEHLLFEDVLLLDDSMSNVRSAQEDGMTAFHIKEPLSPDIWMQCCNSL